MPKLLSPEEFESQFGRGMTADAPRAGLGTRFGAGIDAVQAGLYGLGEAAGLPLGGLRRENQAEADLSRQRYFRDNPDDPQSFRDVDGIGSGLRYVRGLAVDSAPYLAGTLAGGLAGGLPGALAVGSTFGTGDVLQNQRDQAGETNLLAAAPLGVAYGAIDSLTGVGGALARRSLRSTGLKALDGAGTRYLDNLGGVTGGLARTGAQVGKQGLVEGIGETGQEVINQFGRMAVDPTVELLDPEAQERYLESFVGGAALGGAFGGTMGGWRRSEGYQAPTRTVDQGQFDLTQEGGGAPSAQPYNLVTQPDPLQDRINQALGIQRNRAPKNYAQLFEQAAREDSGQRAIDPNTGTEIPLDMGRALERQAGFDSPMAPAAPAPAAQPTPQEALQATAQQYGVKPVVIGDDTNTVAFDLLGGRVYGQAQLTQMLTELAVSNQGKPEAQQQIEQAVVNAGLVNFDGKPVTGAKQVASKIKSAIQKLNLAEAQDAQTAAAILNDQIAQLVAKGKNEADPQLGKLGMAYEALTGQAPPALAAAPTVQTQETPNATRDGAPSSQGGQSGAVGQPAPGSAGGGGAVVQPSVGVAGSVPPSDANAGGAAPGVGAGSQPADALPDAGTQRAAAVAGPEVQAWEDYKPDGDATTFDQLPDNEKDIWRQALQVKERGGSVNLYKVAEALGPRVAADERRMEILEKTFGKRNAQIIFDVRRMGMSEREAGEKNGITQQAINKIVGPKAQATWEDKLRQAQAKHGFTDEEIATLFQNSASDVEAARAAANERTGADELIDTDSVDEDQGIQANLNTFVDTAGGSGSAVEGFTKAQQQVYETLEQLRAAEEGGVDAETLDALRTKLDEAVAAIAEVEAQERELIRAKAGKVSRKEAKAEADQKMAMQGRDINADEAVAPEAAETTEASGPDLRSDFDKAREAWDKVAAGIADAPLFDDLNRDQQETFVEFGEENWTKSDVMTELKKLSDAGMVFRERRSMATSGRSGQPVSMREQTLDRLERFPGISRALDVYRRAGLGKVIDSIGGWFVADDSVGWDGAFTVVDGQPAIAFKVGSLTNQDVIEWTTHHELGHAVDQVHLEGGGVYSGLPEMNVRVVDNRIVPMGPVMNQVFQHYQNEPSSDLSKHLVYPFDRNQNGDLDAQGVREEVFAQLWATYNTPMGREFLEDNLPDVAEFMETVYEDVSQTDFAAAAGDGQAQAGQAGQTGQVRAAQRGQVQGSGAALRQGRAQVSWSERDKPSGWLRNEALRSWYNRLADVYDEAFSPDEAFEVALDGATPREAAVLRALRKDDFLGFDYPHQALQAVMEEPGAFELSILLKAAITRLANSTSLGQTFRENRTQGSQPQGEVLKTINRLPKDAREPVSNVWRNLSRWTRKGLDRVVFTADLLDRAAKEGVASTNKFRRLLELRGAMARDLELDVERVADLYAAVPEAERGHGEGSVNQFIFDSTREGKWGEDQPNMKADPEMKARFNKLSDESKAFVRAVFKHGSDMLALKKRTVEESTRAIYGDLIAKETDAKKKARLERDMAAELAKFNRLFAIREGLPYAPIKRVGDYVVIAKSRDYMRAEEAGDEKTLRQLEKDPDHYHVSFMESENEAVRLATQLEDQGFFKGGIEYAEKEQMRDRLFGGESMLNALTKLKAMVDAQADDDTSGKEKQAVARMQRLVSDLYLQTLAENSARKTEMRRRGVSGEVDMLKAFTMQGQADAQFLASVKYASPTQAAIQEMRKQVKAGPVGTRNRRSELFNEIMARYVQTLDFTPTPIADRINRMTSIWYLLTSPGYYLVNLTQPFMMSLPVMAGRHDYAASSNAIVKAYGEIGPLIKSAAKDINQQLAYDKLPSDVRDVVKELVKRGRVDIGIDTELGTFQVEGDSKLSAGWNKVDKFLRSASQKLEAVNRLSTAIAAYRMELAKTGSKDKAVEYADRILTETHGDYTRFNAPRAFNTALGKVMLQFRKFQLIQLTLLGRLFQEARFNPAERMAAIKSLTLVLGHTVAMAGATGLPGYAAFAWLLGALLGDDDEKFDLTQKLRSFIGDEDVANLILKGAPARAGVDLSGKLGMGNALSVLPFTDLNLTDKDSIMQAVGALISGPAGGLVGKAADGIGLVANGNYYKGLEQLLPTGFANMMKAGRIASEGVTRRNGDLVMSPEEVSFLEAAVQSLGFTPTDQAVRSERARVVQETDQNFRDRSRSIKNDYSKAVREGDSDAKAEAREAWKKLQEARKAKGYTPQPMSDLLKAPQESAKRAKQVADGVPFNRQNQKFVQQLVEN